MCRNDYRINPSQGFLATSSTSSSWPQARHELAGELELPHRQSARSVVLSFPPLAQNISVWSCVLIHQRRFGVCGKALAWLADFLSDRTQVIHIAVNPSQQPWCLEFHRVAVCHELLYHLFADDMQGMLHGPPADVPRIVSTLTDCFTDVSHWCAAKRLRSL